MSIQFNAVATVVGTAWTAFKSTVQSKRLHMQYDEDGALYTVWTLDGPVVYQCLIWKGTVPSTIVAGYSQATNDADKTNFETVFKPTANQAFSNSRKVTYAAEASFNGANNKDMISIFNPAGSGKIILLRRAWAAVPNVSGATVIIPFEIRHATAITTGTAVASKALDTADPVAAAVIRQEPTGITDHAAPLWWTWVEQINTAQGSTDSTTHTLGNDMSMSEVKCITLREGNGCYLRQVASNTSPFRMGFLFTEEVA